MRGQDRPSGQNLESCLRRALLKAATGEMERRGDIPNSIYLTFSEVFSFQKSKGRIPEYSDLNSHFFMVFISSFLFLI